MLYVLSEKKICTILSFSQSLLLFFTLFFAFYSQYVCLSKTCAQKEYIHRTHNSNVEILRPATAPHYTFSSHYHTNRYAFDWAASRELVLNTKKEATTQLSRNENQISLASQELQCTIHQSIMLLVLYISAWIHV